jgi:hypothetical protein
VTRVNQIYYHSNYEGMINQRIEKLEKALYIEEYLFNIEKGRLIKESFLRLRLEKPKVEREIELALPGGTRVLKE